MSHPVSILAPSVSAPLMQLYLYNKCYVQIDCFKALMITPVEETFFMNVADKRLTHCMRL